MPLYEYECTACHKRTEKIQKFSDPEITACPRCGGALERVLSAPAIAFKGGGWFADGYGNARPAPADSGSSSEGGSAGSENKGTSGDSKSSESKAGDSKAGDSKSGDSKSDSSTSAPATSAPTSAPTSTPAASAPASKP